VSLADATLFACVGRVPGQHSLDLSNKSANCIYNALGTNGFGNAFGCSIETNFLSPTVMVTLLKALLATKSIEEFRAANQVYKFGKINRRNNSKL